MEDEFRKHLEGFEGRRKADVRFKSEVEKYHRDNTKRLDDLVLATNKQNEVLERIETQTIKTNGRVGVLEIEQQRAREWQSYIKGGLTIIAVIIIPILLFLITKGT